MITRLLIIATVLALSLGQIAKISLPGQINLYLWDVILALAIIFWLPNNRHLVLKLMTRPVLKEGTLFILVALMATVFSLRLFPASQVLTGSLYLVRWTAFFFLIPMTITSFHTQRLTLLLALVLAGFLLALGGWIQLQILPDLAPLVRHGWDPHQSRLVSTLLDPNFTGALVVLTMILITAYQLNRQFNQILVALGMTFLYLSLVYTFSRGAYLMFLTSFLAIAYLRSWKVGLLALVAFFLSLQINPRVEHRVSGAITVDASAAHRLTSWERAQALIREYPILGVGFNNLRYAQLKHGFIGEDDPWLGGHAGAGTDSSLLFVFATTGLVGGLVFLLFVYRLLRELLPLVKTDWAALASLTSLFGLLFHSLVVNSMFYPPIMIFVFTTLGLALGDKLLDD